MRLKREEALTGALTLATGSVLVAALLALGAPGLFKRTRTYYIGFDNAGAMEVGTQVFLAGRRVGEVVSLRSPVPASERPPDHPEFEALVEVKVDGDACIYRSARVRMQQYGWFGQQMIDFVKGDEQSGLAPSGTTFAGERVAGYNELAEMATVTIREMSATLANIKDLTGKNGDLQKTAANAREFTDTIKREPWRLIWKSKKPLPARNEGAQQARR